MSPTENLAASPRSWTWLHTALLPLHPHDRLATVWPIFAKSLVAVVVETLSDCQYSSPPPTILSCWVSCTVVQTAVIQFSHVTIHFTGCSYYWNLPTQPIAMHIVTCALHERIPGLCDDLVQSWDCARSLQNSEIVYAISKLLCVISIPKMCCAIPRLCKFLECMEHKYTRLHVQMKHNALMAYKYILWDRSTWWWACTIKTMNYDNMLWNSLLCAILLNSRMGFWLAYVYLAIF